MVMWLQETDAQTNQYLYKYLVEFNRELYQVLPEQLSHANIRTQAIIVRELYQCYLWSTRLISQSNSAPN